MRLLELVEKWVVGGGGRGGGWLNANLVLCFGPNLFPSSLLLDLDQAEEKENSKDLN
jgi:hypothetical protein